MTTPRRAGSPGSVSTPRSVCPTQSKNSGVSRNSKDTFRGERGHRRIDQPRTRLDLRRLPETGALQDANSDVDTRGIEFCNPGPGSGRHRGRRRRADFQPPDSSDVFAGDVEASLLELAREPRRNAVPADLDRVSIADPLAQWRETLSIAGRGAGDFH